jgi:tRNA A-37 threonylcarbamoyl transferase component Bud32
VTDAAAPQPTIPGLTGFSVLARGGYATVYRAIQESVAREVAVKVENRTLEGDRDRRRFLREARAAGRMSSHPHVVDLFDAGVTGDGHPYLIMEMCDGSYAERMKTSPLSAIEARDVGVKIADALSDAHLLGVLHRDVKPANILMTRFGEPALADFGLAILAESRDHSITLDVLTPAYAPPEMFRHAPPSPAADVYALCATLYALMRGRPPRWREDRSPSLVSLVDMFAEPVPDLAGVPVEMMSLLRLGLSNDPEARPSAAQLRDALIGLPLQPGAAPVHVPTLDPTGRVLGTSAPGTAADDPTQPRWLAASALADRRPGGNRGRLLVIGAAVAAAVVLAGLLVRYAGPGGEPEIKPSFFAGPSTPVGTSPSSARACVISAALPGAHCVSKAECFDTLTVSGGVARAGSLPCDRPHTWEAFATADLPADATGVGYQSVRSTPAIADVCNNVTLAVLDLSLGLDWTVDVLPPSPEDFAKGVRSVRCLAGKGPNKLTKAVFAPGG